MLQLDTAERTRAQRFAFPHLRTRFVAAHAFVRQVLGRYLGISPGSVRYAYTAQGKPRLSNNGEVRFNLSHSADLAALAIAWNREIGIDIEKTHEIADMLTSARRYFSAGNRLVARPASGCFEFCVLHLLDSKGGLPEGPRRRFVIPSGPVSGAADHRFGTVAACGIRRACRVRTMVYDTAADTFRDRRSCRGRLLTANSSAVDCRIKLVDRTYPDPWILTPKPVFGARGAFVLSAARRGQRHRVPCLAGQSCPTMSRWRRFSYRGELIELRKLHSQGWMG